MYLASAHERLEKRTVNKILINIYTKIVAQVIITIWLGNIFIFSICFTNKKYTFVFSATVIL